MKNIIYIFLLIVCINIANAQEPIGIAVKTNILNILAKRPSLSIEKTFAKKYGLEISYRSGILNWGRDYKFDGFLLRTKIYSTEIELNEVTPFYGLYFGSLNKKIISNAEVDNTGFVSIGRNRNFEANSLRTGINIGFLLLTKKRFLLETTTGLGYGKYFDMRNNLYQPAPKSYFDFQLALSLGYYF